MSNKITLVPQPAYPTLVDLDTCVREAQASLKTSEPNHVLAVLMVYHNTLLKELRDSNPPTDKKIKLSTPYR